MQRVEQTKQLLGNLVKQARTSTMVQQELALRAGTSKNTVSRLERGKGINSDTLLSVLYQLDLLDPVLATIEEQYALVQENPLRKGSKSDQELPNDFQGLCVHYSLHNTRPKDDLERVLAGSGMGVGALTFSLSRKASKPKRNINTLGDLATLLRGKEALLQDKEIPAEARKIWEYGSSMGGAGPKSLIEGAQTEGTQTQGNQTTGTQVEERVKSYLVKFNRPNDWFNVCRVEHASMSMLRELGELHVTVAATKIITCPTEDVLLVERFDMKDQMPSQHFLSANSLINQAKLTNASLTDAYSYGALAEFIMKYGAEPRDAHQFYARMLFNIYLGNTDDHARNHGFFIL